VCPFSLCRVLATWGEIGGPRGRIAVVVFRFGLGDCWINGAMMVRELEGTISTPQICSLALKKLNELVNAVDYWE